MATAKEKTYSVGEIVEAARKWRSDFKHAEAAEVLIEMLPKVHTLITEAEQRRDAILADIEKQTVRPEQERVKAEAAIAATKAEYVQALQAAQQDYNLKYKQVTQAHEIAVTAANDLVSKQAATLRQETEKEYAELVSKINANRDSLEKILVTIRADISKEQSVAVDLKKAVSALRAEYANKSESLTAMVADAESRLSAARIEYDKIKESLSAISIRLG